MDHSVAAMKTALAALGYIAYFVGLLFGAIVLYSYHIGALV